MAVVRARGVVVADMLGNTGDGNDMHPTIGELVPPILTATALPATNYRR